MTDRVQTAIFRNGSRTYFHSSLFFPRLVRDDVFSLYGFVRVADDLVDQVPAKSREFSAFCDRWREAERGSGTGDPVIDSFCELSRRKGFRREWTEAFLASMASDLSTTRYATMRDLDRYLFGSAEVIGLYMAKILDLPEPCQPQAMLLGRAMQFINFIRDIDEDQALGRTYFPEEDLHRYGLSSLSSGEAHAHPGAFRSFIRFQISRYLGWQAAAEQGFSAIPSRYLIPIKTASDMYKWTAAVIAEDPFVVYRKKVKPSISRIIVSIAANAFHIPALRVMPAGSPHSHDM
jgi:phytoene synthase